MSKRKTKEEFKLEFSYHMSDSYILMDDYVNSKTHVRVLHKKCNTIYKVTPTKILSGRKCPKCNGTRKRTNEEFKEDVFNLVGDNYVFLDEYINVNTKLRVLHKKCNNYYQVTPNRFINGNDRCPYCSKNKKKDTETVSSEVRKITNDNYMLIGEYNTVNDLITLKHKQCNREFNTTYNRFLNAGNRCPYCSPNKKLTTHDFSLYVDKVTESEYEIKGTYINSNTPILIQHKKCNFIYKVIPYNFRKGDRCPKCKLSKGEQSISTVLDDLQIPYINQYRDHDCKYKRKLSFDFYLPSYNIIIEYDGIQHFNSSSFSNDIKDFNDQITRDEIKDRWCKKNHMKLIRIPYTQFSNLKSIIEKIIENDQETITSLREEYSILKRY